MFKKVLGLFAVGIATLSAEDKKVEIKKADEKIIVAESVDQKDKVSLKDVKAFYNDYLAKSLKLSFNEKTFEFFVNSYLKFKRLKTHAKDSGVYDNEAIKKKATDVEKNVPKAKVIQIQISDYLAANPKFLKELYEKMKKSLGKGEMQVTAAHLVVEKKSEAEDLIKKINSSKTALKTFEKMVSEKSLDTMTKGKKGELPTLLKPFYPPKIWGKIIGSKAGKAFADPIESPKGYSVLFIKKIEALKVPKFEKVKEKLEKDIKSGSSPLASEVIGKVMESMKEGMKFYNLKGKEFSPSDKPNFDKKDAVDLGTVSDDMVRVRFKDGKTLTQKDIKGRYTEFTDNLPGIPLNMIDGIVVLKTAMDILTDQLVKKHKLDKDEKTLAEAKRKKDEIFLQAAAQKITDKFIKDQSLDKKAYGDYQDSFPKNEFKYRLKMILLNKEGEAKAVLKEILEKGKSFESMVPNSIHKETKDNGGDLGDYVARMDLPDQMQKSLKNVKPGVLVRKPLKMGNKGYGVFKVVDRIKISPRPFNEWIRQNQKILVRLHQAKAVQTLEKKYPYTVYSITGKK